MTTDQSAEAARRIKEETVGTLREVRRAERMRRTRRSLAEVSMLLLTAYVAIWLHTAYLDLCIQQPFLSETQAGVCRVSFWPWSGGIEPGVQLNQRVPAPIHDH